MTGGTVFWFFPYHNSRYGWASLTVRPVFASIGLLRHDRSCMESAALSCRGYLGLAAAFQTIDKIRQFAEKGAQIRWSHSIPLFDGPARKGRENARGRFGPTAFGDNEGRIGPAGRIRSFRVRRQPETPM